MTTFDVVPPARRPPAADLVGLGRAGAVLHVLGSAQGCWPPRLGTGEPVSVGAGFADGIAAADRAADCGADLLVVDPVDPPGGAVAAAALLGLDAVAAVGTRPAPDWAQRILAVRDGLRACAAQVGDPQTLLGCVDDPALAWLAGLLAQSAARATPALLGGGAATAALVATRLAPGAPAWWVAADSPPTPAGVAAFAELGLIPLLDLGLPGPGAAALCHGLLRAAVASLAEPRDG